MQYRVIIHDDASWAQRPQTDPAPDPAKGCGQVRHRSPHPCVRPAMPDIVLGALTRPAYALLRVAFLLASFGLCEPELELEGVAGQHPNRWLATLAC